MKDLIEVILSFALGFTYSLIFLALNLIKVILSFALGSIYGFIFLVLGGPTEILGFNTLFVFGVGNTILTTLIDTIKEG